jgi:predicted DCC family thiol-disulfide oxidoreductase YuxK
MPLDVAAVQPQLPTNGQSRANGAMKNSWVVNHGRNFVRRVGCIRLLLVLMGFSLGLWIVFGKLVVPPVIESAYRGDSWPFLNGIISGQAVHPVRHYLQVWDRVALGYLVSTLGFLLIMLVASSPAFVRRIVGEATPGSLGAIRMWTCFILLLTTCLEDLGSIASLPAEVRSPSGMLGYLYAFPIGLAGLVTSEMGLRAFQVLTQLLLFLGLVGWRTRLVLPLGAFSYFLLLGILIDYSFFWHQNLVPLYVMLVLCFTPCGDGWSLDRLRKIYRGQTVPDSGLASPVYGWSRYLCWVVIALPYVATGLSKLQDGGLFWWNATNMRTNLYSDTLTPREFDWALSLYLPHVPDIFLSLMGLFALFSETFFGLVLFSRVARRVFPVAAITMHIGIFLFQRILFLDLILLQLVFFDFIPVRKAIGDRFAVKHGRLQVLYDGLCPLCCRTVRLLTAFDLFSRLVFVDFRRLDLHVYNRSHMLNLALKDLQEEMYVIFRAEAYRGFYGYRRIALALPALWPLAPWLFLPGISSLGAWVYGYVARRRLNFAWCDSHCSVRRSEEGVSAKIATTGDAVPGFGHVFAVSGIILVALLCWFYRIEFYPLTSWHLYSASDTSGKVEYWKVLAQRESGVSSRARLEDTIGAIALDSRYRPFLGKCFAERPHDVEICKKFLGAAASAYNKKAQPGERLTHYEIQGWAWDFLSYPFDPNYGRLTDRFVFDINTGKALREKQLADRSVTDPAPLREPHAVKDGDGVAR